MKCICRRGVYWVDADPRCQVHGATARALLNLAQQNAERTCDCGCGWLAAEGLGLRSWELSAWRDGTLNRRVEP